jgi:N-acetyl-gamma-glutamyl-phosphate reductase
MTIEKIKAGVIGATGYAGVELVRILSGHPHVELTAVSSVSFSGEELSKIYPSLRGSVDLTLDGGPEEMMRRCNVIFASLPHGLSQELAKGCMDRNIVFIDLGADFRLEKEEDYQNWYGESFLDEEMHKQAVYGLCELFRQEIRDARLIANPGCYPTSVALALYPALRAGLIDVEGIIIDSKSGVTGAGRTLTPNTHFPECNESFFAYKAGGHRHTPEIEQTLSKLADRPVRVTFTPHLLPVNRGILSTIYCGCKSAPDTLRRCYREAYEEEPFVVLLEDGEYANIGNVKLSNSCHVSLHFDKRTDRLIICSAIDNMVKGAAGQAVQNMNIVFGLEETTGLSAMAPAF